MELTQYVLHCLKAPTLYEKLNNDFVSPAFDIRQLIYFFGL